MAFRYRPDRILLSLAFFLRLRLIRLETKPHNHCLLIRRNCAVDFLAGPRSWFDWPVFPGQRSVFADRNFPQPYHNI